jgi:hypothetical protein
MTLSAPLTAKNHSAVKYTAIWQEGELYEREWLMHLFNPYISNHVADGKHDLVLDNSIVFDSFVYARDPSYYEAFRGKNAFLVHLSDEFYELGADRYLPFRGVFRTGWSGVFNPKHVFVLPLGYGTEMRTGNLEASQRRYAWSFIGEAGKSSRPDAVKELSPIEPHFCFSTTTVPGMTFFQRSAQARKRISRADVVAILGQSAFAPSPMGNANLECFRVYEGLECGAIPIVERRLGIDYYRSLFGDHPILTVRSWSEARRIIEDLLRNPERMDELQKQCVQWWRQYKSIMVERVGQFLADRSRAHDQLVPLRSRLPNLPLWNYFELLRHHSLAAIGRRVKLQSSRLIQDRKWRVAPKMSAKHPPRSQAN